jgi:hypothetical protein
MVLYLALNVNWSAGCVEVHDLWLCAQQSILGKLSVGETHQVNRPMMLV